MGFCHLQHKEGEPINRWLQMFSVLTSVRSLHSQMHSPIRSDCLPHAGAMLRADVGLSGFPGSYFTAILHLSQHEALYMCHTPLPAPIPHQMTKCNKQEWISLSIILQNSVAQSHTTFSNNIC